MINQQGKSPLPLWERVDAKRTGEGPPRKRPYSQPAISRSIRPSSSATAGGVSLRQGM